MPPPPPLTAPASQCMAPERRVDAHMLRAAFRDGLELHDLIGEGKLVLQDDLTQRR